MEYYLKVRASTFKTRRVYLEKQLIPFFKDTPIASISTDDVRNFYAYLKRKGTSQKPSAPSINFCQHYFKRPLKDMKDKPKDPDPSADPWNTSEIGCFLAVAEREEKDEMYDFTLSTGLRQGEVFALPWNNIDIEKKQVTVTRSVSYDEDGNPELIPKARSSYRTLSIPPYLIEKLNKLKEKQEKQKKRFGDNYQHGLDLVFPTMNGGFQNPSNVRRQFYNLIKKAKDRRITFHDLRHTHATTLIRGGVQPRVVQYRLGHADIETTFRYYGHLWANADQQAADLFEEMMVKRLKKE